MLHKQASTSQWHIPELCEINSEVNEHSEMNHDLDCYHTIGFTKKNYNWNYNVIYDEKEPNSTFL